MQGTVVDCPGPAIQGVECPRRQVEVTVDVFAVDADGGRSLEPVGTVSSDGTGHFELNLRSGRYVLIPRTPPLAVIPKPMEVIIGDGITKVVLQFDRGMRGAVRPSKVGPPPSQ